MNGRGLTIVAATAVGIATLIGTSAAAAPAPKWQLVPGNTAVRP